jgi:hypothetical protein
MKVNILIYENILELTSFANLIDKVIPSLVITGGIKCYSFSTEVIAKYINVPSYITDIRLHIYNGNYSDYSKCNHVFDLVIMDSGPIIDIGYYSIIKVEGKNKFKLDFMPKTNKEKSLNYCSFLNAINYWSDSILDGYNIPNTKSKDLGTDSFVQGLKDIISERDRNISDIETLRNENSALNNKIIELQSKLDSILKIIN